MLLNGNITYKALTVVMNFTVSSAAMLWPNKLCGYFCSTNTPFDFSTFLQNADCREIYVQTGKSKQRANYWHFNTSSSLVFSPQPISYCSPSIFDPHSIRSSKNSKLVCLRDHHGDNFFYPLWSLRGHGGSTLTPIGMIDTGPRVSEVSRCTYLSGFAIHWP